MNATEMIRNHTRSAFLKLGYSERDANLVASDAVRRHQRNTRHQEAITESIKQGKKLYKKVKK